MPDPLAHVAGALEVEVPGDPVLPHVGALGDHAGDRERGWGILVSTNQTWEQTLLSGERGEGWAVRQDPYVADEMRWGFIRPFNQAINNARTDKLDGIWSAPWQEARRGLIPLMTYYEWTGRAEHKQTFAITQEAPFWAAGLWEIRDGVAAYTMLTTDAAPSLSPIHDRMPVLIDPADGLSFFREPDPRSLLQPWNGPLRVFRCENPLRQMATHEGPVPCDFFE